MQLTTKPISTPLSCPLNHDLKLRRKLSNSFSSALGSIIIYFVFKLEAAITIKIMQPNIPMTTPNIALGLQG